MNKNSPTSQPLALGIIGLGRAFSLMLPTLTRHPLLKLTAAFDPRPEARTRFAEEFNATAHASAEQLCADTAVRAVYVASPHQFHVEHVRLAAAHGKHVMVEKPMALSIAECQAMIAAAKATNVALLVGHSHSYDHPYSRARELIAGGDYGRVRMITAFNSTDFLYRPRRPDELNTTLGGGVVFNQAAHQVDVVRLLANSKAVSVRAMTGNWDPTRPTEGAYSALISFANGVFASLTYNGYGHFDSDEFQDWIGELGQQRDPERYGTARKALASAATQEQESILRAARAYGSAGGVAFREVPAVAHNHFGLVIIACEKADLRPTPHGVLIYGNETRRLDPLTPPDVPRREVIDEFYAATISGEPPLHSGQWGMATLEICLAILRSANQGKEVTLMHQV